MTDIVERAARVLAENWQNMHTNESLGKQQMLAQALADAGLLAVPARTVPTRDEIADALFQWNTLDDPYFVIYGRSGDDSEGNPYYPIADAVLTLLTNQPTVNEAKAQALEEAADAWQTGGWADAPRYPDQVQERIAHGQFVTEWLGQRAQQIRDGK